jgi:hypothetical protein
MPFSIAQPKNPTSLGAITVVLRDIPASINSMTGEPIPEAKSAIYEVVILDQNGHRINVQGDAGDLVPYLTQTDITWLLDFVGRLRIKAENEFLGA